MFVCMWLSTEGTAMGKDQCNPLGMRCLLKMKSMGIVEDSYRISDEPTSSQWPHVSVTYFQPFQLVQSRGPDASGADKPQAASKQIAAHVGCKGSFTGVENGGKNPTDGGKDGHDVSPGTPVSSSNLCLKRDPANNKYIREKIRYSPKELFKKCLAHM